MADPSFVQISNNKFQIPNNRYKTQIPKSKSQKKTDKSYLCAVGCFLSLDLVFWFLVLLSSNYNRDFVLIRLYYFFQFPGTVSATG